MIKQLRINNSLYQEVKSDLRKPHDHAAERVGFAFTRPAGPSVLVIVEYLPVPDDYYIKDKTVGARIDDRAIAMAMKKADNEQLGIMHVHEHGNNGYPTFSRTDLASHGDFLRGFRLANPNASHGFLLLSRNKMMARIWTPDSSDPKDIYRYTIVGLPLMSWFGFGGK